MKEVTVVAFCDGDHEIRVAAGVERTITIDGSKPVVLDLCQECDGTILNVLHLMEHGAVVAAKVKKDAPKKSTAARPKADPVPDEDPSPSSTMTTCPECGHVSTSRQGLGQHLRAQHGKGFRDLRRAESAA